MINIFEGDTDNMGFWRDSDNNGDENTTLEAARNVTLNANNWIDVGSAIDALTATGVWEDGEPIVDTEEDPQDPGSPGVR